MFGITFLTDEEKEQHKIARRVTALKAKRVSIREQRDTLNEQQKKVTEELESYDIK